MNVKKILLFLLIFTVVKSIAQPTTNPQTPPTRAANQVISVYSGAYTNLTGVNFNPNWGQSGLASATTFTLSGNEMRHYPNMNYQGIDIAAGGSAMNLTSLDTFSIDVWTTNCTSLELFLVTNANGERQITRPLTLNSWNHIKIPLSDYLNIFGGATLNAVKELKLVGNPFGTSNIYVDNIYFFTDRVLPTLSNFSVPSKQLGDAAFALTAPTSNSTGAFTYTSSNTNVATISGNTVTILSAGSSTITATQAAAGSFSTGTISANFVVTVSPLSTNAQNPTKPAANVISLFSNTYANVPVSTWRTGWSNGSSAVLDTAISGNDIKKYTGVDFVGIEFPAIDVTLADSVHISMWTPSAQAFGIKLVNQGGGPANENIVWFETNTGSHSFPKPAQGQWNTYNIPLSLFATSNGALRLTNRNQLFQILFTGLAPFSDNTFYIDNLYFSSSTNVLPVDFKAFTAIKANNGVQLTWEVANEVNVKGYSVEKSVNGANFAAIGFVNASSKNSYNFTDASAVNGTVYYRIKSVDKDGSVKYSSTKSVNNNEATAEYAIYPNPAANELVVKNLVGTNNISIVDVTGKVVLSRVNVTNNTATINITAVSKGLYTVVVNNGKENKTFKLVIEK